MSLMVYIPFFFLEINYEMTSVTEYFNIYDNKIFLGSCFRAWKHRGLNGDLTLHPVRVFPLPGR